MIEPPSVNNLYPDPNEILSVVMCWFGVDKSRHSDTHTSGHVTFYVNTRSLV